MGLRGRRGAGFLHAGPSSETNLLRRGCRRSRRRQDGGERAHGHWGDVSDCGSFDSYDEINSSSDAGSFGVSRRKKVLDDALFEFFSNEAVKSLKRDFSKFCRDSDIWIENKRPRVSGIGKDSFHLYSSKYFFEVLHRLTGEQKGVIQKFGFGCLLSLSKTYIPSPFTRWLVFYFQFLFYFFTCLCLNVFYTDTPAAVANRPVDKTSSIKAPEMHPVAKVKSRLSLRLPDNSASPLCQDDLISPIGRMALSPFPDAKDPSKAAVPSVLDNLFAKTDKGSRQDPIPVADKTSKTVLVEKSPECTITGTSILKDRQAKALEDVDAVYNRTVHGSSSHVIPLAHKEAAGKTPIRDVSHVVDVDNLPDVGHNTGKQDLVILQPKTLLVFPLASNKRFPVTDEDIMYYCAIVEIAYTKGIQKTYALEYHGVHCSYISLGQTLMRDGHIDNFLIPCFCRKLFEDNHPSKSGRHYFFSYIGESILELNDTVHEKLVTTSFFGASLASKGKRLDYSDRV